MVPVIIGSTIQSDEHSGGARPEVSRGICPILAAQRSDFLNFQQPTGYLSLSSANIFEFSSRKYLYPGGWVS